MATKPQTLERRADDIDRIKTGGARMIAAQDLLDSIDAFRERVAAIRDLGALEAAEAEGWTVRQISASLKFSSGRGQALVNRGRSIRARTSDVA